MEINELKLNVAQNIFYLRTVNNMTQSELGEKLNYSDKAISKWERAEGLPDAFVLTKIGEIFGVTVDYLLNEHKEQDKKIETRPKSRLKRHISGIVLWGIIAVAMLLMVVLYLTTDTLYWQIIIYSLPLTFSVQLILCAVWWKDRDTFFFASLLVWSVLATIYVAMLSQNNWQLFLIGIPLQIIVFLCYRMKITITITKKTKSSLPKDKENGKKGEDEGKSEKNASQKQ